MRLYLDIDLYKAEEKSSVYDAPPMQIKSRGVNPSQEWIQRKVWELTGEYKIRHLYPQILRNIKVESGGKQYRRPGKYLMSEAGAMGLGQLMEKTAEGLGVDRKKSGDNLRGMVKYQAQNYRAAVEAGMSPSDAAEFVKISYFSGGIGGPGANVSKVEKHNQRALARLRKTNPNAKIFDVPWRQLKGGARVVGMHGGPKKWVANMRRATDRGKRLGTNTYVDSRTGKTKKRLSPAVDRYARAVDRKKVKEHYIPIGENRREAEEFGLKGYRDQSAGVSMPTRQTMARPEDLRPTPSKPKSVASEGLYLKSPVAAPARKQAETKRVAGLDAASKDLGLPAPSKVLSRQPKSVAVQPRPPVKVSKSLFQSEYFIEV